jgi:hypothetical protein
MWSLISRRLSSLLLCSLFANSVWAGMTDIKFGQSQIADSQWNVSACLNTTTCQIYSKNPGTAYRIPWTNGKLSWAAGDYVKFSLSGNGSFPYTATQFTSAGAVKSVMGNGKIVNIGQDYFFFVGSDNNTGQLFSGSSGMIGTAGVTWTGTLNPTLAQADAYADSNYSTTPLSPGQTAAPAAPPPPPPPTPVYSSSITPAQQSRKNAELTGITGHVVTANIEGNDNDIYITQINGRHALVLDVQGNSNEILIYQKGTSLSVSHYLESAIIGSNNTINIQQHDAGKTAFANVYGNHNTLNMTQSGAGNHFLDLTLIGDNHTASLSQSGAGNHAATVQLTNGGGAWNFQLNQTGSSSKTYSLPHSMSDGSAVSGTCNVAGGCNLIVNQP